MARRVSLVSPRRALQDCVRLCGSQRKAAARLGVSQPYVYAVLHGHKPASARLLKRLGLRTLTVRDEAAE